jgi:hypothetical protein
LYVVSSDIHRHIDITNKPLDPVFFVSRCGKINTYTPSPTALGAEEENDPRQSSIGAAVEFARINNLLGVFVDADLLVSLSPFAEIGLPHAPNPGPSPISDSRRPERRTSGWHTWGVRLIRGSDCNVWGRSHACRRVFWRWKGGFH